MVFRPIFGAHSATVVRRPAASNKIGRSLGFAMDVGEGGAGRRLVIVDTDGNIHPRIGL